MCFNHRIFLPQVKVKQLHVTTIPRNWVGQPWLALDWTEGNYTIGWGAFNLVYHGHVVRIVDVYGGFSDDNKHRVVYFDSKNQNIWISGKWGFIQTVYLFIANFFFVKHYEQFN